MAKELTTTLSSSIVEKSQYDTKNFYIERTFIKHIFMTGEDHLSSRIHMIRKNSKNLEEILIIAADKKMILLSDYAATGKTTTFMHLSMKLKEKFQNYWISFIDIKDHLNECVENIQDLPFLIKVLNITNEIEAEKFTNLYNADKVILLFDGYTGIPYKCKEFFNKLFQNIQKSTKNQQWITSQPQDTDDLMTNLNQTSYKLIPFDDVKSLKFIHYILKNLHIQDNAKRVFKYIQTVYKHFSSDDQSIFNPLILRMMTEFYLKNKHKTFNPYSLMNEMIHDKFKDARSETSKMSILQVHQAYALQMFYKDGLRDNLTKYQRDDDDYESEPDVDPHESDIDSDAEHASDAECTTSYDYAWITIDIQKLQLLKRWKSEKSNWTSEEISKYGLLDIDYFNTCDEYPIFKQESLADFFVAQYIIDKMFDVNNDEPKLSVKLFYSLIKEHNLFITTIVENQTPKKLSDEIFKFAISNQMHKVIKKEDLFKNFFCCDERFLKVFKFAGNTTIFQKQCRRDYYYHSDEMIRIYERILSVEWIRYTGYKLNDENNYEVPTDEEIELIFDVDFIKKTIDEKDEDSNTTKVECKKLYKLFCFVERVKFPRKDFLRIFEYFAFKIFANSFRSRALIEKLIKIIRNNINKCKDEFYTILKEKIFDENFFVETITPATDEYVRNMADFYDKFVNYSLNDSTIENFKVRFLVKFCCFETFASLHDKYQICSQNEIQEFLIAYSVPIIHTIIYHKLHNSLTKNLEIITKNIFDYKSINQLWKFIINRYKGNSNVHYKGHNVLSFVRKEYESEKNNKFYMHGLKIAQNVIIMIFRWLEMMQVSRVAPRR